MTPKKPKPKEPTPREELQLLTKELFNSKEGKAWLKGYKKQISYHRPAVEMASTIPGGIPVGVYSCRKDVVHFIEEALEL